MALKFKTGIGILDNILNGSNALSNFNKNIKSNSSGATRSFESNKSNEIVTQYTNPDGLTVTTYGDGRIDVERNPKAYNTDFTNSTNYKNLQNAINSYNSAAKPIDLTSIINDYNKNNQATIDTLNKTLGDTINTLNTKNNQTRNDLLTSLKRFQESNAESMRTQQQDFNASRASLEDEAFMNQRNAMANASSRGLGGSGLQQLAQLQNRIAAGKNVSALAQKNQNAQDALRKALTQEEEDYKTKVTNLEENLANAIIEAQNKTAQQINAANTNNTNLINNLKYNEQVRQRNAQAQASSAQASLKNLLNNMQEGVTTLQGAQKSFEQELKSTINKYLTTNKKSDVSKLGKDTKSKLSNELDEIYKNYITRVGGDLKTYGNVAAGYGLDNSYTDTAVSNLKTIYNKYKVS